MLMYPDWTHKQSYPGWRKDCSWPAITDETRRRQEEDALQRLRDKWANRPVEER